MWSPPVFASEGLSVGEHGELVDNSRVEELDVVGAGLDPVVRTGSPPPRTLTLAVKVVVISEAFTRSETKR